MRIVVCFLLFLLNYPSVLYAQSDEIRNRQRAIFIYNITQQISYGTAIPNDYFSIGIMGSDLLTAEFQKMQQENRTVKGKPLKLVKFGSVDEIEQVQLVYVNKKLNYDLGEVLEKTSGKSILVVSEGYGYNSSMINMIDIDDVFQFEINQTRLNQEKITVSPSLKNLAINSADRWHEMYQQSTKSLKEERQKVAQQKSLILQQQSQILEQQDLMVSQQSRLKEQIEQIDVRNVAVEQLQVKINDQQKLYDEKVAAHTVLEKHLEDEQQEFDLRKKEILALDKTLSEQRDLLSNQSSQIDSQQEILSQQRSELNDQRKFIFLFVILSLLAIIIVVVLSRSYRIKKKLNRILETKNVSIEAYSDELKEKNKEMEQFAYVVSHDLQEPLNSITGLLGFIDIDQLDESGKMGVEMIASSTVRMRELIKGLLEHSKLGHQVPFALVDCSRLLADVKDNLAQVLKDTGTTLEVGNLPTVMGHDVKLTLLFQNLISNALKFNKKGVKPVVSIQATESTDDRGGVCWQFEVKDNGIGIAEKNREKIFLIFQRLHGRSEYEGTGIGLAHCKKIVDLHRGKIWVESEVGVGSSFYFTI